MIFHDTKLKGVLLIEPKIFSDNRGCFFESWNRRTYPEMGLPVSFAQDNISVSRKSVLRGLHYQHPQGQGKLISVLEGEIFDVAADIRPDSPTFKQWIGVTLSSENRHQLWIPEGFAHGFLVISDQAIVSYKASQFYSPQNEGTLLWNDPELNINWPTNAPILSEKDLRGLNLSAVSKDKLPTLCTASKSD